MISHEAKDLGRTTKYQFNTSATVKIGSGVAAATISNPLCATVQGNKLKKPVRINGFFKDQQADKFTATIFSLAGWTKEISSDNQGFVEFTPEWAGKYMIEISRTDEEKGDHNGKAFEKYGVAPLCW